MVLNHAEIPYYLGTFVLFIKLFVGGNNWWYRKVIINVLEVIGLR